MGSSAGCVRCVHTILPKSPHPNTIPMFRYPCTRAHNTSSHINLALSVEPADFTGLFRRAHGFHRAHGFFRAMLM